MTKLRLLLIIATAFVLGLKAEHFVSEARADKSVTYLSAGVAWDQYTIRPDPNVPGGVLAEFCAHAPIQGGGQGPSICENFVVGAANQLAIDSTALATARGVPQWKLRQGL